MKLPPENECGCAEYKYKFDENVLIKRPNRKEQLQTQMLPYAIQPLELNMHSHPIEFGQLF